MEVAAEIDMKDKAPVEKRSVDRDGPYFRDVR